MSSWIVALIVFGCGFGGVLAGALLRRFLPDHHLHHDSKEVMKIGAGVIATLTALVLGLMISSAKTSFDAINDGLTQCGTDVILLHRVLTQYGPETKPIREKLKSAVGSVITRLWPEEADGLGKGDRANVGLVLTDIHDSLLNLVPDKDSRKALQAQAVQGIVELRQHLLQVMQRREIPLPIPFLAIMIFWLAVLFASLGLLAPPNATNLAVLFLCAASVAGAVFLLVEMSHPTTGIMKVSPTPMLNAFRALSR